MDKKGSFQLLVDPAAALAAAKRLSLSLPVRKQLIKKEQDSDENGLAEPDWEAAPIRIV